MSGTVEIAVVDVRPVLVELLTSSSFFEHDAETIADAGLWPARAGLGDDAIASLVTLLSQSASGEVDPRGQPLVMAETPSFLMLDGSSAAGPVAARYASDWLGVHAPIAGFAGVAIKSSRPLAEPAWAIRVLAEVGLAALCVTNFGLRDTAGNPQGRQKIVAAFPTHEGPRHVEVDAGGDGLSAAVVSILTNGRLPKEKADAPNPLQSEHLLVAFDPEAGMGNAATARRLGLSIPEAVAIELSDRVTLSPETCEALSAAAEGQGVRFPW